MLYGVRKGRRVERRIAEGKGTWHGHNTIQKVEAPDIGETDKR